MTLTNTRIKKLRKALDLTQQEFADRLGMKQNTIATYEMGRSTPGSPTIVSICREFRVNEEWLRTGSGEMFLPPPADAIDKLIEEYKLPREFRSLIDKYLDLTPDQQEAVVKYMHDVAADLMAAERADNVPPWTEEEHAAWEAEARAEAEQVYQQVLQEKKAEAGYSASPPDLLARDGPGEGSRQHSANVTDNKNRPRCW